mmetsp:Transcript_18492/g.27938  ORF Transcript_18492/g.27938 Transcript_18492/m.27938 type:complete len:399 (-) Transcript_18492:79-1275(-)|eukprot:CAMPEP_0178925592 /NCGR_PEP_ID=MMETSP0786-20121207/18003_1 /TAXON_ID=186022 /ORGANISM="Thalassionema frauenfeldii, Strain CCMP 1798" /LENGTH=398 /DNA_ID=CAMNT_0020600501 /DNA_START=36 /DNA_END=1232 /DNA_ORIENTATION=-
MGSCRSKPAVEKKSEDLSQNSSTDVDVFKFDDNQSSISSLLRTVIPNLLPVIRRVVSRRLIEKGIVLYYEEPVPPVFDVDMPDEDLPLRPLKMHVKDVKLVSAETLRADMKKYPEFGWPEKDRFEELMDAGPEKEPGMVVLDLVKVDLTIRLAKGIEVVVPVKKFGMKVDLELGYGGKVEEGWLRFKGPLMRVWYVLETNKLYVSFMERPDIIPHINVNADRGKGDFLSMDFTESSTALDDALERVLCEFGPGLSGPSDSGGKKKRLNSEDGETSWLGDSLGGFIVEILKRKGAKVQPGTPVEIDLTDKLTNICNVLVGKPRASATIKMKIEQLNKELEKAEEREASQLLPTTANKKEQNPAVTEENNTRTIEDDKPEEEVSSWLLDNFCDAPCQPKA